MRPQPTSDEIAAFLADHHGEPVSDLEPLTGGFWSSAFAYRCGGADLVLRLSGMREGFEADRFAHGYSRPGLPVPSVHHIGKAFDRHVAISDRCNGRFLEEVRTSEAATVGSAVDTLLAAMRSVDPPRPLRAGGWHAWLRDHFVDDPTRHVTGWRSVLTANPDLAHLFGRCQDTVEQLLPVCPERRDLIHGDLLHANVLVSDTADEITGVFSWKCSTWGDFLYDVAWLTFWSPWHPGVGAIDPFGRTLTAEDLNPADLEDAAARHHCYEVHIGAQHMAWYAWTGDDDEMARLVHHLNAVLARGPLT